MPAHVEVVGMPERDDRGQYRTAVSDDEILSFFEQAARPYQTAQSVSDQFGLERSTAYRRLQRLADDEKLRKDEVGARAVVWWSARETQPMQAPLDEDKPTPVNPDDPIFDRTTVTAGEPTDTSERVDEFVARSAYGGTR